MVAALVAAALAPIATGPEPVKALVFLLGATGGRYISEFLKGAIDRLRSQDGSGPRSSIEVQHELERGLLACLEAHDELAAGLRADAAALLASVQGVRAALEAASDDVQLALTNAFTQLGGEFAECGWMLDESMRTLTAIQRTQRLHTDLARQTLVEIRPARPAPSRSWRARRAGRGWGALPVYGVGGVRGRGRAVVLRTRAGGR